MVVEQRFPHPTEYHHQALQEAIDIARRYPQAKGFLVIDLDDTRDNSRIPLAKKLHLFFRSSHPHLQDQFPQLNMVVERGSRASYAPLVGEGFYQAVYEYIEQRPNHFSSMPLVDPQLPEVLKELTQEGYIPILWLTARHKATAEVSRKSGIKFGLPNLPVYAHFPDDHDVVKMKTDVLVELAEALLGQDIVMIDDYANLIMHLDKLNHPNIMGVQLETNRFPDSLAKRKAIWGTMVPTIRRIHQR